MNESSTAHSQAQVLPTVRTDLRDANAALRPKALKLKQTAKLLGVSEKTVMRLVVRGKLRRLPHLRHIVITMASIDEFLNA